MNTLAIATLTSAVSMTVARVLADAPGTEKNQ